MWHKADSRFRLLLAFGCFAVSVFFDAVGDSVIQNIGGGQQKKFRETTDVAVQVMS